MRSIPNATCDWRTVWSSRTNRQGSPGRSPRASVASSGRSLPPTSRRVRTSRRICSAREGSITQLPSAANCRLDRPFGWSSTVCSISPVPCTGPHRRPESSPTNCLRRSAETDLEAARTAWKARAATVSRFITPDAVLNRIVDKGMLDGYFLTKRWNGQWIVFDSVCYRCQWDDASTKWFYALDLMGDHATAAKLLDTVFARQGKRKPAGMRTREGCFSDVTNISRDGSDASWASCNGWALWAMTQHARLSNNRTWLAEHKQQILDGCAWIIRERQASRERPGNPCSGLIYGKFVCDCRTRKSADRLFHLHGRHQLHGPQPDGEAPGGMGTSRGPGASGRSGGVSEGHRGRDRPADRQVPGPVVRSLGPSCSQA